MKRPTFFFLLILIFSAENAFFAEEGSLEPKELTLTVQEAVDYARTNSRVVAVPKAGVPLTTVQQKINALIEENFVQDETLSFEAAGDFSDMIEMGKGFVIVIIMAMVLVFAVMASQFESLKDPFIIYFTIPLSFIGVALIYWMVGQSLSMMSILGVLMLVGVIVNNGIVLVDAANNLRKNGMSLEEACVESAKSRLRPILMTSLAMVIGLLPMMFASGVGKNGNQTLGAAAVGGMLIGTLCQLFVVPTLFVIFQSIQEKFSPMKFEGDDEESDVTTELAQYANRPVEYKLQK